MLTARMFKDVTGLRRETPDIDLFFLKTISWVNRVAFFRLPKKDCHAIEQVFNIVGRSPITP